MTSHRIALSAVLLTTLTIMQPNAASATKLPAIGTGSATASDPTPKPTSPVVDSSWMKDKGRLTGKTKTTTHRHRQTQRQETRKAKKGTSGTREIPITREHLPVNEALVEFRLNDGICGPVRPDGTRSGPARCRYWNIPNPGAEQTLEQSVDLIQQQIRTQTVLVGFPELAVKVQPAGRTLVNLDTIVYTDKRKTTRRDVTLLGFPVTIEGTPVSYTWNFGDGSPAVTTTSPGKPYPAKEITHKYLKRRSVQVAVTTNYSARFNVAGTGWRSITGTLPVTGPSTDLLVREAVPVLVDPGR